MPGMQERELDLLAPDGGQAFKNVRPLLADQAWQSIKYLSPKPRFRN